MAGATCTAVTLYSGQLVAQSEYSVVTTFAPVSGLWKFVYTTPVGSRSVIVRFQRRVAFATGECYQLALIYTPHFSIVRMYLEQVLRIPGHVGGASCLCANVVLTQYPACS